MVISEKDVKIEQMVEKEDIKELKQLNEAVILIFEITREKCLYVPSDQEHCDLPKLAAKAEKAARHLANARMHSQRMTNLTKKVMNDIKGIRSPKAKRIKPLLTKRESEVIARCFTLNHWLDEARKIVEQVKVHIANLYSPATFLPSVMCKLVASDSNRAHQLITNIIANMRELYSMEKQIEHILKEAEE